MAAGKLTKGRLVQILITLSVLIGAFIWRTFTYESDSVVTCRMDKPCQLRVEGELVTVSRKENAAYYTFSPWDEHWEVEVNGKTEFQAGMLLLFTNDEPRIDLKIDRNITLKLIGTP
ncbi:hypothetical protein V4D05_16580 [Vibrio mimicus]|uniref:hypothetical protein n=1 Tax=Vibrio mimicus TaxID=674 RepID=UPI002F9403F2